MTRPASKNQITELWAEEFQAGGFCSLCGNYGVIDTVGKLFTPAGQDCGARNYCLCPNGRLLKRKGIEIKGERIPSVFDDIDGADTLCVPNHMSSAGAELFNLSRELAEKGWQEEQVDRLREIAAWSTLGRPSDYERALVQVAAGVVGVMRRAGYPFDETKPIVTQYEDFVKHQ